MNAKRPSLDTPLGSSFRLLSCIRNAFAVVLSSIKATVHFVYAESYRTVRDYPSQYNSELDLYSTVSYYTNAYVCYYVYRKERRPK